MNSIKKKNKITFKPGATRARGVTTVQDILANVDWVPPSLPPLTGKGFLIILEDNEAVIKMTIKGRSPNLRHVARTHRVDLDFLFDIFKKNQGIAIRYVGTKSQIADILTKGQFTTVQWQVLSRLAQVCSPGIPLGVTPSSKATEEKKKKDKKKNPKKKVSFVEETGGYNATICIDIGKEKMGNKETPNINVVSRPTVCLSLIHI